MTKEAIDQTIRTMHCLPDEIVRVMKTYYRMCTNPGWPNRSTEMLVEDARRFANEHQKALEELFGWLEVNGLGDKINRES